jgi:hypothetical protein
MLQKQALPINFAGGMNTKVDDKQLDIGQLYSITNGVYSSPKQIKKRNGYNAYNNYDVDGTQIPTPESLAAFNNELVAFGNERLFSYSDNTQRWVNKGVMFNLNVESLSIMRNAYNTSKLTCDANFNIGAFAWKDSRGGCRYSISDLDTNTLFQADQSLTLLGDNPKIVVKQNFFYFFFTEGTALKYRKVNSANPSTILSEVTVINNLSNVNPRYDLLSLNDRIYIAYQSSLVNPLQIFYIDEVDTLSSAVSIAGESASGTVSINTDSSLRIWVSYYNGTAVKIACFSYTLGALLLSATTVEVVANVDNISSISTGSTSQSLLYTITAASNSNYLIRKNTVTLVGVVGTPSVFLRSVGQASKLFENEGVQYTLVVHESSLQSTYFLATLSGEIQGRFSAGIGGTVIEQNSLDLFPMLANGKYMCVNQIKSNVESNGTTFASTYGVNRTLINFAPSLNYQDSGLGQNLYVTGGILKNYDGSVVTEDNFFLYPENVAFGTTGSSGGFMAAGTYQYSAVYAWYDNRGQLHRSAASIPVTIVISTGGVVHTQEVIIPTLRLTYKTNVFIEVYRTESNGTLFYKVSSTTNPTFNNTSVDTITYIDTLNDTSILSKELLYTTGGVLDNDPAPNASIITNWKNRLVLAGLENTQQIAYSKLLVPGNPAQFSDFFRLTISNQGGPITGLGVLDDKLIIFKRSSLFILSGNGPNDLGQQDDFGSPDRIASDVGCVDPSSIVITPKGLMFKSEKGIYLLDRGSSLSYIGVEVEAYNSLTVTAATLIPNNNQVRFLTSDKLALVYDLYLERWSIFDNHNGKDAEILINNYVYLRNDGLIFYEDGSYLDNGQPISLQVDTGWLSFAGVQGFQRVYKMLGLGEFYSQHKLMIECAFNYNPSFINQTIIDSESFVNSKTYGDSATYGSDVLYGGPGLLNAYQFRTDMKVQKAQSIRVKITELQNDTYGRGLSLSNLNFEVGLKSGTGKVNQSQTFGTK